jgi:hypothetical protein
MRNQVTQVATALGIAALAVACGGSTNNGEGRNTAESAPRANGVVQQIKVEGCVAPAPSNPGQYVLREVFMPSPAEQPIDQATAHHPPVVNGTWVRLTGGGTSLDLKDYLGQRVAVTGTIKDTGENTLATSGHLGSNEEKWARSSRDSNSNPARNITPTTAAPAGADANGDAPRVAVEHIEKLADSCRER